MFVVAAGVILLSAEHFASALVETGAELGISEFLLVQWLAPLASEGPELIVAGLYAWRLHTDEALGTLVSSKVNQWTLLVGTLPIVFAASSGGPARPADRAGAARGAAAHRGPVDARDRAARRPHAVGARRRAAAGPVLQPVRAERGGAARAARQ
jgi:hypothetical protein